jgi:uncharacterized protein (TIGR00661 family)
MANILYGVNGEGAGHSTRAREVLSHLVARGHKVHVASFDRGLQNLKSSFNVTEIYGFRFAYVNNRVRYKRTIARNLITIPQAAKSMSRLNDLVDDWKIDVVITDFEPLTCHLGHKKHLPVISIDNQHCLTNAVVSYPKQYRSRQVGHAPHDPARQCLPRNLFFYRAGQEAKHFSVSSVTASGNS